MNKKIKLVNLYITQLKYIYVVLDRTFEKVTTTSVPIIICMEK